MITILAFKSNQTQEHAENNVTSLVDSLRDQVAGFELVQALVMKPEDFNRRVEDEIREIADETITRHRSATKGD